MLAAQLEVDESKVLMLGHFYAADKIKLAAFDKIKSMFKDADLLDRVMQEPERLKKIIEYKRELDDLLKGIAKI